VRSNKVKEEKLEHAEALKTENLHDKLYVDKYIQRRIIFKQQVSQNSGNLSCVGEWRKV
jgi:hypothetical protein